MTTHQVTLPNFNQIDTNDQTAIITQLVSLFAGPVEDCRFLTMITPARFDKLEKERRQVAMGREEEWERRGLLQEVRMIGDLSKAELRKARHYFLDFENTISAGELNHWRVTAQPAVPQLPTGDYAEFTDHLAPVLRKEKGGYDSDHSRPYCTVIASYQLSRSWDWKYPFVQTVTDASGPMMICLDARKVHPEKVANAAEFWLNMKANGYDRQADIARQEAEMALRLRNEAIHHVRVLFMLLDKDLATLRKRADSLRKVCTQYMKVDRLVGYQRAAAEMFTPKRNPAIPEGHYNTTSSTLAVSAGMWGSGREQPGRGFYIGITLDEVSPHISYLEWKGNNPFHGMILGKTGKGKTVGAQALAWRMAEQGTQVVLLEPNGHSRRLLALAGGKNVSYSRLSYAETRLNILDVSYENPSEQYDHVMTLLALLLDPMGNNPRQFNTLEIAAIRKALSETYRHYRWEELLQDQTLTPTLTVFCQKLRQVGERVEGQHRTGYSLADAAHYLADEIEGLYVYGDYADVFNTASNTDLTLKERIVLFDFSLVPETRRGLFYYAILSGINLQIRRHPRKRAVIVDEVAHMAKEPTLMRFLADLVKTVRTYGAAIILIDQDLEAFIGKEGASGNRIDVTSGQFIINNVTWTIAYGLKEDAAVRLMHHYPDEILPSHALALARAGSDEEYGRGKAILRANGKTDWVYWKLRPMEAEALVGS